MNGLMILLLSSWISNAASDLTVVDSGTTRYVPYGHGFTVICTVTGNDTFFAWKNPVGAVVHNNSEYQYTVLNDKHSLKIDPMLVKDGGKWTCISNEGREDSLILHVTVTINGIPNLQQNLISGLPGIIEVNIVGYPQPNFKWLKNGSEVITLGGGYRTASNGSLIISSVDTTDEGTYKVEAEKNSFETKIENIVVTVFVRPTFSSVIVEENRTTGGNITFKCNATGKPLPSIVWKKGSDNITEDSRHVITSTGLAIKKIEPSDVGEYTCVASNSVGVSKQVSKLIYVIVPPEIPKFSPDVRKVKKGNLFKINCHATGDPTPDVNWMKDGTALPSEQQIKSAGESKVKIDNVQLIHSGTYECSAKNGAWDSTGKEIVVSQSLNVEVEYPPEFNSKERTIESGIGKRVEIKCSASGSPAPNVTMSLRGKDLNGTLMSNSIQTNLSIVIPDTKPGHFGVYTCRASNQLKYIEQQVDLTIPLDMPEILIVKPGCNNVSFSWSVDTKKFIEIKEYQVTIKGPVLYQKTRFRSGNVSKDTFTGLQEDSDYTLLVTQVTGVTRIGHQSSKVFKTNTCFQKFAKFVADGNGFTCSWPEASGNVDNYILKFRIKDSKKKWETRTFKKASATVSGLEQGKMYEFRVFVTIGGKERAHTNVEDIKIPQVKPTTVITSTDKDKEPGSTTETPSKPTKPPPASVARKSGLSGGAVAAIVIVIILLVLIAVDIFCCFFNQCGVVHMCAAACAGKNRDKYNVDGSPEEGTKLKEIDEAGKDDPEA